MLRAFFLDAGAYERGAFKGVERPLGLRGLMKDASVGWGLGNAGPLTAIQSSTTLRMRPPSLNNGGSAPTSLCQEAGD